MNYKKIMYTIGQLVRCVYGEEVPTNVSLNIIRRPVLGLGIINQRGDLIKAKNQEEVMMLINKLPGDIKDPDIMSFEAQGAFWLGYYHYAKLADDVKNFGADELTEVGRALYGDQWQTNLAKELDLSDARRIRYWLTGRQIPVGVWLDIAALLKQKQMTIDSVIKKISQ
jgi:hypothetical protein